MNIDHKAGTGGELLAASWRLLRTQPRLVLLPVLALLIVAIFVDGYAAGWEHGAQVLLAGACYLLLGWLVTLLEVAFCHEALRALSGEPVNLGRGLRYAARRWQAVLLWTFVASAVGLALQTVGERLDWFGRFSGGLFELGWGAVILLSTPVLVRREGLNPFGVMRESARLLRRVLGESFVGIMGILIFTVASLFAFGLLFLFPASLAVGWAGNYIPWVPAVFGLCVLLLALAALGVFVAIGSVYCCAVYVYASEGVVPEPDARDLMDTTWKVRGLGG